MDIKKKIWDYFDDEVEFPKNIVDNPIPYGETWEYVSSTLLNAFINYVKPIACYVVNRYTKETDDITESKVSVCDKGKFGNWEKFEGTKKELIDSIVSGDKEMYHTDLSCFDDDIIIVARVEDEEFFENNGKYIFFWFDMDGADCCIGKFKTDDSEENIIDSVENWLEEEFVKNKNHEATHDDNSSGYHKLPLSFIKGQVKF